MRGVIGMRMARRLIKAAGFVDDVRMAGFGLMVVRFDVGQRPGDRFQPLGVRSGRDAVRVIIAGRLMIIFPPRSFVGIMRLIMGIEWRIVVVPCGVVGCLVTGIGVEMMRCRFGGQRIGTGAVNDVALDALAIAAATRVAVTGAAAFGSAAFSLLFGFAMGALIGLNQGLTVSDRDLIIIRVDFAEGQKTMAVAAIFDEGGLQRRLNTRHLGQIDIATQLFALGGLEVKFFDAVAADHNDPGLFRVGGVDKHFVGHFSALVGGGRVSRLARIAPPGDATVHLIRGGGEGQNAILGAGPNQIRGRQHDMGSFRSTSARWFRRSWSAIVCGASKRRPV
jgi:hypothetical protein